MKFPLFSRVALKINLPEQKLQRGDLATVVEFHAGSSDQEPGYSVEVFNAVGETVAVITLRESQIEALTPNEILHVRSLASSLG
jgi:hypothetical protein